MSDRFKHWEVNKKTLEALKKMERSCYACGKTVPKKAKNYLYCSVECEFYMMNSIGIFMIGDHPVLTENSTNRKKHIYGIEQ